MSDYSILPVHLAVKSIRDSGYKNAAYALAELIDNSIQAGAQRVEVLCKEEELFIARRTRRRLERVAVLDNGSGMTMAVLRAALQFGNGQYLENRTGIGRFGMGLPSSSMSQAKRVDVWTWTAGTESAVRTYLDLDEIESRNQVQVPEPVAQAIPQEWLNLAKEDEVGRSGTLVVWRKLDRCAWRTGRALLKNAEHLVGRIYRRFVSDGRVRIRMAAVGPNGESLNYEVRPNDPLYLLDATSCPWDEEPMFEAYGDPHFFQASDGNGNTHQVRVRFSSAKQSARKGHNPGGRPHGKHAAANIGVSIMRADRELELQRAGWTIGYDPVERWWGCEIDIPTAFDEVFGVTNNKQSATALAEIANLSIAEIVQREGVDTLQELLETWEAEGDPRAILVRIKQAVSANTTALRKLLTTGTKNTRGRRRHHSGPTSPEDKATEATKERQRLGHKGSSDADEQKSEDERVREVTDNLVDAGMSDEDAQERARQIVVEDQRKFEFVHRDMDGAAFFSVRPKGGVLLIQLNINHPAYVHLVALLEEPLDSGDLASLQTRMAKSYDGLKLLLEAWARYEDELPPERKDTARDARADWGRIAREFLRQD